MKIKQKIKQEKRSKIINIYEEYTPLAYRVVEEMDQAVLNVMRVVWRKHRKNLSIEEFKTLTFDVLEFRKNFPMVDNSGEWSP